MQQRSGLDAALISQVSQTIKELRSTAGTLTGAALVGAGRQQALGQGRWTQAARQSGRPHSDAQATSPGGLNRAGPRQRQDYGPLAANG